jgi:diacylglycerol kinase (ATP)
LRSRRSQKTITEPGRTVFLVNPASDGGATGRRWPELARRAAAAGLTGDAVFSEHVGHARHLAREAVASGAALVVAVGGDGTVMEAANGLAGSDAVLAIVPRGSGGDFGRTFGIPRRLEDAARVALTGETRTIDLGRTTYRAWGGGEEEAYFANIASAGMSGAVAQRTNATTKAFGGRLSYLWATIAVFARWRNAEVRVSVDGEARRGRMQDVIVANARYFGGGMLICPDAKPDDGALDVLLLGDVTKVDLVTTMPKIYRGTHLPHPKAELLRGSVVEVEAETPLPVELDGEQPGTTPARFEVVPRALRLRVPRDA